LGLENDRGLAGKELFPGEHPVEGVFELLPHDKPSVLRAGHAVQGDSVAKQTDGRMALVTRPIRIASLSAAAKSHGGWRPLASSRRSRLLALSRSSWLTYG
jgi:hypothetical protein